MFRTEQFVYLVALQPEDHWCLVLVYIVKGYIHTQNSTSMIRMISEIEHRCGNYKKRPYFKHEIVQVIIVFPFSYYFDLFMNFKINACY
jgi:hypothetical protein